MQVKHVIPKHPQMLSPASAAARVGRGSFATVSTGLAKCIIHYLDNTMMAILDSSILKLESWQCTCTVLCCDLSSGTLLQLEQVSRANALRNRVP